MRTKNNSKSVWAQNSIRVSGIALILLALFLTLTQAARADIPGCSNATGGVSGTGRGKAMSGKIGAQDVSIAFGGVIFVDLTGVGSPGQSNDIQVFCVDLTRTIGVGDCFNAGNALTGDVWKALYYYPPDNTQSDTENAARQAVIWHFSDNFVPTSPQDIVTRYNAILADLAGKSNPPSSTPPTMSISPTNVSIPANHTVQFTLTVSQNGMPLPSPVTITLTTDFGTLSANSVTTNNQVTFSITSAQSGTSHITASFNYQLPVGTQFDAVIAGKQKLVLGQQTTGSVVAPAVVEWNAPTASVLNTFGATALKKSAKVEWETGSEAQVMGFMLWRSNKRDGKYVQVNAEMIPAQMLGQLGGASYAFTDKSVKAGKTYFYKLEVLGAADVLEWSSVARVKFAGK